MITKYLVIRGNNGFNDFLCTFIPACDYILDARKNGLELKPIVQWNQINDSLWKIFDVSDSINTEFINSSNICDKSYKLTMNNMSKPIDWKLLLDYNDWDHLILWNLGGGVNIANKFFTYLDITESFKKILSDHYYSLGGKYIAIHIRISDYLNKYLIQEKINEKNKISAYNTYIQNSIQVINKLKKEYIKILLCTDNYDLIKNCVDNNQVFSFSLPKFLMDRGEDLSQLDRFHGLHINNYYRKYNCTDSDFCTNAFLDYFLMVLSDNIIVSEFGQFSRSALRLKRLVDSNNLRHKLLI